MDWQNNSIFLIYNPLTPLVKQVYANWKNFIAMPLNRHWLASQE